MASLVNGSGNLGKIFNAVLHSRAAFFFFLGPERAGARKRLPGRRLKRIGCKIASAGPKNG